MGGVLVWVMLSVAARDGNGRMDAVRNAGTLTLGVGGAWTALLLARRQWHQERDSRAGWHDAEQRRITDMYVKAVEQLGHTAAAVRLGGLYALDRLGQQHDEYRQVIVDVWCSYLRMPLKRADEDGEPTGEVQVRITAQRLLKARLRDPRPASERDTVQPEATGEFWPRMRVDLTAAVLHEPNFGGCHLGDAWFTGCRTTGKALFDQAVFHGDATFTGAACEQDLRLDGAVFDGAVSFAEMAVTGHTSIVGTTFEGAVSFREAQCDGGLMILGCAFRDSADLSGMRLQGMAVLASTEFHGRPRIDDGRPMLGAPPATTDVTVLDDLDAGDKRWELSFAKDGPHVRLANPPDPHAARSSTPPTPSPAPTE
ncbi:pentapeptide repeat-containing protein [Actinorhabdospora filicis]|uniref:pentapeptide repeat-containing protein n=1 Tax=Actinorhabdospora filicis TaxID=1785913 RepID=UPI002557108A|nr:pentapeptide repeat-containing protein [Actinorhabdospora filicis]